MKHKLVAAHPYYILLLLIACTYVGREVQRGARASSNLTFCRRLQNVDLAGNLTFCKRQHQNVAGGGIFSMLALRPKRGRKERGEERKRKRGEARISFDLPFRYFYPAHTVLASNAIQWRQTQK